MKLTSETPYWFARNGLGPAYPFLEKDLVCDIAVIGAGITGSMIAFELSKLGRSMVILDSRDVCCGSTAASTALLQYEIDVSLVDMAKLVGESNAQRAYQLAHNSIDTLERIVSETRIECDFQRGISIFHASTERQAKKLSLEAEARKAIGLNVSFHDSNEVQQRFALPGKAALSSSQAASCDPFRLAHGLLQLCHKQGVQIYDRTMVTACDASNDTVKLSTNRGAAIEAKNVVFANGYESQNWLRERVVNLDNTYAFVSQPLNDLGICDQQWLFWEANQPYLYLRFTKDQRLLAGGEDDAFHNPRARDRRLPRKIKKIESKVRQLIPSLKFEVEHSWAGTFGKTRDGLAYIGISSEYPRCIFGLGFGGNGIPFSAIAAELIPSMIVGKHSPDLQLFRFGR